MIHTIEDFYSESEKWISLFNAFAEKHSLIGETVVDHICYKCGSRDSFESTRALFETESHYLHQSIISGRRIAYVKLKKDIPTVLGFLSFLELSDQKPDGSQKESFDHIEVFPSAYSYDEMIARLGKNEQIVKVERPHHTTHDIDIGGFFFRCTKEPLIQKIIRSEM